jgi:hypothetical protein
LDSRHGFTGLGIRTMGRNMGKEPHQGVAMAGDAAVTGAQQT